jgi:hypothetical protein
LTKEASLSTSAVPASSEGESLSTSDATVVSIVGETRHRCVVNSFLLALIFVFTIQYRARQ